MDEKEVNLLKENREFEAVGGFYRTQSTTINTSSYNSILNTLTIFITAVAGISLLVRGIGVINIMLVSVTERIKEIGIIKALGATNIEILSQFMVEAIISTIFSNLLGLVIGIGGTISIGAYVDIIPVFTKNIIPICNYLYS